MASDGSLLLSEGRHGLTVEFRASRKYPMPPMRARTTTIAPIASHGTCR
jgi:hypothetical protein